MSVSTSILPTYGQIQQWDNEKLKNVHMLLFDYNVYPGLPDDSKEDVDNYMNNVHSEYQQRFS